MMSSSSLPDLGSLVMACILWMAEESAPARCPAGVLVVPRGV